MTTPSAERVRSEDAAYFYLEGPTTPYHVASLMLVDGPTPSEEELLDAIRERIAFTPRLMQRLQTVPLARPRWVDDPHFDLGYHVRRTCVSSPGTERQLLELAARLHERHLPHSRPLWECWMIDGLAGGRFALLFKIHHSLVDGVSGAGLMGALLDPEPEPRRYDAEPWIARPIPAGRRLVLSSLVDTVTAPVRIARGLLHEARSPAQLLRRTYQVVSALVTLAENVVDPTPHSPFNVSIGPNRLVAVARAPLDDLRDVKTSLGGTVNDVVLAAASGGMRDLLRSRGMDLRALTLRALVPVSMHRDGEAHAGNQVTGVIAPLPVSEADAGRRLAIIRRGTRHAKASPQGPGTEVLLGAAAALPPSVARLLAGAQTSQRVFNVSVTNIPGPPMPLWFRGRRVEEIVPLPPLSANCALIVAAMSYAGQMTFGLVADPDALPDAPLVAEGIEKAIVDLRHEAEGSS